MWWFIFGPVPYFHESPLTFEVLGIYQLFGTSKSATRIHGLLQRGPWTRCCVHVAEASIPSNPTLLR